MTEPFIGEIQIFGFNFNPRGWAFCNGATLPLQQNTALFALIGTSYGGNGQTTFQLPNFAGRAGCEQGQGAGLTPRRIGDAFGSNTVALTATEMPAHGHALVAFAQPDAAQKNGTPAPNCGFSTLGNANARAFAAGPANTQFAPAMIGANHGGSTPHANQQPYLGINFCIALQGVFPSFG